MKEPIEHRLIHLLKEREYEPEIYRGPGDYWIITFEYNDGKRIHTISPESLIADQWWLV
jgi:hypothetical protein